MGIAAGSHACPQWEVDGKSTCLGGKPDKFRWGTVEKRCDSQMGKPWDPEGADVLVGRGGRGWVQHFPIVLNASLPPPLPTPPRESNPLVKAAVGVVAAPFGIVSVFALYKYDPPAAIVLAEGACGLLATEEQPLNVLLPRAFALP